MPRADRRIPARRLLARRGLAAGAAALALTCFGVAVGGGAGAAEAGPVAEPTPYPTLVPTPVPTTGPTADPTTGPTEEPSGTPTPTPSDPPSTDPTGEPTTGPTEDPEETGVLEVSEAVFRWGVSNQSNARSHNPLSINFLAAGVANPGGGGRQLRQDQWRAVQGNTEIQKRRPDGSYARATWKGLGTTADGRTSIGMERDFSDHHVVMRGGTGTVDPASGDAEVSWKGTFTVVYYGGNTVFTISDPRLEVEDGVGRVTATMGGFYADRNDTTRWQRAPQRSATIVDLPDVDLGVLGTTVQPAYDGVRTSGGSEPQRREGDEWGSFPQSFVSYLVPLNTDQFWYSTGLSTDSTKRPLPMTFSWTAREVAPPAVTPSDEPSATPSNPVVTPPPATGTDAPTVGGVAPGTSDPASGALAAGGLPGAGVPAGAVGTATAEGTGTLPASTQLAASAPSTDAAAVSGSPWWWVGGSALLLSALLLLLPGGVPLPVSRRH
ncbi:hypothetical protein GHK92_08500 [Nocardioides sp. dk4132]|uniref:hypothetical protein n=1 Tax=unclassified Nocardioides TaxID=2615069 RepID=UPI001297325A|nr:MULTISPECIES: hypothetical protein [unclassified Nocardioides]MQW75911.1 hypothetical protein [Nocardioides sp. dk4132]QGA08772.1 hypothetical protein GFH29_16260 [Nocardioides sp. dk884]